MIQFIKYRKIGFTFSSVLVLFSIFILFNYGLKPGIDFTGGSLLEVKYTNDRPSINEIQDQLSGLGIGAVQVQPSDETGVLLRMRFLSEQEHQSVLSALRSGVGAVEEVKNNPGVVVESDNKDFAVDIGINTKNTESNSPKVLEERFETIGPTVSANLRKRSFSAAIAVVLIIILYISYTFRKVSKPVKSWKYGVAAVVALLHDVLIPIAVFSLLGHFMGVEVDIPFVVALLTILGYSVNDTIIVFDRIRENLIIRGSDNFDETVNLGINQTISRSINTSFTTLLVLFALFFFGGSSVHYFALTLIIGIISGAYSSIFIASPLLVYWESLKRQS